MIITIQEIDPAYQTYRVIVEGGGQSHDGEFSNHKSVIMKQGTFIEACEAAKRYIGDGTSEIRIDKFLCYV